METSKRQFEYFQERFMYYFDRYKLTGWRVYFDHKLIEDNYAEIYANLVGRVVTVVFNTYWKKDKARPLTKKEIDLTARHEATHLLLGPLYFLGCTRYTTTDEMETACEALVRHLETLLDK